MKKLIYWFSLFLFAGAAWGLEPRTPQEVCSQLDEPQKTTCFGLIPGSRFDPLATGLCGLDHMKDSGNALNCMETVQDGTYKSSDALAVCESITSPGHATTCLDEVADENFQKLAVRVCIHVGTDEQMVECVKAVANRTYDPEDVAACDQPPFGDETVRCLNQRGQDDPEEKQFRKGQEEWNNWVNTNGQARTAPEPRKHLLKDILEATKKDPDFISKCIQPQQGDNSDIEEKLKKLGIPIYEGKYIIIKNK
jgi:hypothetical protein